MTISEDSQLGLRFLKSDVKIHCLRLLESNTSNTIAAFDKKIDVQKQQLEFIEKSKELFKEETKNNTLIESKFDEKEMLRILDKDFILPDVPYNESFYEKIGSFGTVEDMFKSDHLTKYFLICASVYQAAELIKIGENFTGRTFKDIKPGHYVYLMGKHQMIRFMVAERGIKGIYYDDKANIVFEWGVEKETGEYFHNSADISQFSQIMQLLTFIELGDIEVTLIHPRQKQKAERKEDNMYNATNNTVFVVDSTWNKILVRTDGFAVRGHFRLQPCGDGMRDRKLIWINAFEKNGYIRKPKASILRAI
jgi:hypothetical protein